MGRKLPIPLVADDGLVALDDSGLKEPGLGRERENCRVLGRRSDKPPITPIPPIVPPIRPSPPGEAGRLLFLETIIEPLIDAVGDLFQTVNATLAGLDISNGLSPLSALSKR